MAAQSSILAGRIPWTEEPGGLLSMGLHRVGRDWSNSACMHALEKEMATHSSVLAWRIPGMEEPDGLLSVGSHRIGHDWSDLAAAAARFVIAFLPRSKHFWVSWLQSPSAVILEHKKIKSVTVTVSVGFSSICYEVMGLDAMVLVFWMLSFKPAFSLSSFTFVKRLFCSSSLSAIRAVSPAYLRLFLFLLAILIPDYASSSPAFHMMYSAYKLKSKETIYNLVLLSQFWNTQFWNLFHDKFQLLLLTHKQVSQETGKVVWYSHLFKNFPVCCDPHSQRI